MQGRIDAPPIVFHADDRPAALRCRVESAGVPGSVCLSAAAWQQIDHLAAGKSMGRVDVKGKGEIEIVRFERFR